MKFPARLIALTLTLLLAFSVTAFAKSANQQRAEIQELHANAIDRLYELTPNAQDVLNDAYGYATISATGSQFGLLGGAHGRVGGHDQAPGVGVADGDRGPAGVVEAGGGPAGGGEAGVDGLALVQAGEEDLARARPPGGVGGDHRPRAVGVGELELDNGGDVLAV